MRILLDQNLSPSIKSYLQDIFPDSLHVQDLGLSEAEDLDVWEYARARELVIVSRDSDFLHLSARYGHPPKVVRLAVGNCPTEEIVSLVPDHHNDLLAFYDDENEAYLELP